MALAGAPAHANRFHCGQFNSRPPCSGRAGVVSTRQVSLVCVCPHLSCRFPRPSGRFPRLVGGFFARRYQVAVYERVCRLGGQIGDQFDVPLDRLGRPLDRLGRRVCTPGSVLNGGLLSGSVVMDTCEHANGVRGGCCNACIADGSPCGVGDIFHSRDNFCVDHAGRPHRPHLTDPVSCRLRAKAFLLSAGPLGPRRRPCRPLGRP